MPSSDHLAAFREWALAEDASPEAKWLIRRSEARRLFEQFGEAALRDKMRQDGEHHLLSEIEARDAEIARLRKSLLSGWGGRGA